MRVFLDTNVLVSAFATRGLCADVFRLVLAEHALLTGEVNFAELRKVLGQRLRVPRAGILAVERFNRDRAVVLDPQAPSAVAIRDPDDRWVLAAAEMGQADVLVTGDKDLLTLGKRAPMPIVSPRGFWEIATKAARRAPGRR